MTDSVAFKNWQADKETSSFTSSQEALPKPVLSQTYSGSGPDEMYLVRRSPETRICVESPISPPDRHRERVP